MINDWSYIFRKPITRKSCNQGSLCGTSKLTEQKVLEIRSRGRESQTELAKEFGVLPCSINKIIRRKSWKHI